MPKTKKNPEDKKPDAVIETGNSSNSDVDVADVAVDAVVDDMTTEASKTHKTLTISATSKVSCELNDVWYSFSFSEIRQILDDSNMEKERQDLWDTVNLEVDNQCQDVIQMLKHPGATT